MSALIMIYDLSCQLIQSGGNNLNNTSRMLVWSDDKCYSIYICHQPIKYIMFIIQIYSVLCQALYKITFNY